MRKNYERARNAGQFPARRLVDAGCSSRVILPSLSAPTTLLNNNFFHGNHSHTLRLRQTGLTWWKDERRHAGYRRSTKLCSGRHPIAVDEIEMPTPAKIARHLRQKQSGSDKRCQSNDLVGELRFARNHEIRICGNELSKAFILALETVDKLDCLEFGSAVDSTEISDDGRWRNLPARLASPIRDCQTAKNCDRRMQTLNVQTLPLAALANCKFDLSEAELLRKFVFFNTKISSCQRTTVNL